MKKTLLILLSAIVAIPVFAQAASSTIEQVQGQKATGVWIDVRSAQEYQQGHLVGALNITHENIATEIAKIEPNKDAPIHLYCRSGRRAEVALNILKDLGYTNVTNHGGYDDLVKQGLR